MRLVTGAQRLAWAAALFALALVFLIVAIVTHSAVPLFIMWVPLVAAPFLVLGRPDSGERG
jgi:peptidoglycan/LPS O-acetylase OafA/YrhL